MSNRTEATPQPQPSFVERLAAQQRLGGLVAPLLTAVFAFLMGGAVVAATGHNPIQAYEGIIKGAGLNWFFEIPWKTDTNLLDTYNLTQTLLQTSSLILTGLAVAFAFRCGMFNIGGQGQYMVGLIVANWVGISMIHTPSVLHILVAVVAATLAGAVWAGIAGLLKATVGAHEVITTIMLNWIAYWFGSYVFGQGGPLQNPATPTNPISADVIPSVRLHVRWGDAELQGLHIGFFVAIVALVVYSLILNRTTLGYEVRAVGFNPDAAAYGRVNVKRSFFLAMAISGSFAGLAGGLDMLGYLFRFGTLDVQSNSIGFMAIAVALLGRNTAIGVFLSSTPVRQPALRDDQRPRPQRLRPDAGREPDVDDPGSRRAVRRRRRAHPLALEPTAEARADGPRRSRERRVSVRAQWTSGRVAGPTPRHVAIVGLALGAFSFWVALPPVHARGIEWSLVLGLVGVVLGAAAASRGATRLGVSTMVVNAIGIGLGYAATRSGVGHLQEVFTWSTLIASALVFTTPLAYAAIGGMVSERSGVVNIGLEGMMLMGCFFGIYGADKTGSWALGILIAMLSGGLLALVHAFFSIHLRANQIVGGTAINFLAVGITGYFFVDLYQGQNVPSGVPRIPGREPLLPQGHAATALRLVQPR